jgi:seryl-tRNA synthetase
MLDIKYIRENSEEIKANCKNRLATVDINVLLKLDTQRRELETTINDLRSQLNSGSKTKPTPEAIAEMKALGEQIKAQEASLATVAAQYMDLLNQVPNQTHPDVVVSTNEDDNPVLEIVEEPTKFDFEPKDHIELAAALDLIDFDRATKVTGAKFYYLKNQLVILEQALIRYALDVCQKHGFTLMSTPDLAKRDVLEALGYSPRGESTQIYNIENSDLSLIGTSEITVGGYHMDETLELKDLPIKYAAVSHCFRTEAGSYSKFAKGIFRVHQFTKVEMFQYVTPENSEQTHLDLLAIQREIFTGLALPFRIIDHCTADLGAPAYRTYDLEAWMPGKPARILPGGGPAKDNSMGDWAEITSTSNCTDYQARGLNIKYKTETGERAYVHMLNGTAMALTRVMIAIMENNQQADGTIAIPKALQPYCGFDIIKK